MHNRIPGRRRPWAALLSAVIDLAGSKAEMLRQIEQPWAGVTLSGTRHTFALALAGAEGITASETFIATLREHEFTIPRQLVAVAAMVLVKHQMRPEPKLMIEAELLLHEDV